MDTQDEKADKAGEEFFAEGKRLFYMHIKRVYIQSASRNVFYFINGMDVARSFGALDLILHLCSLKQTGCTVSILFANKHKRGNEYPTFEPSEDCFQYLFRSVW